MKNIVSLILPVLFLCSVYSNVAYADKGELLIKSNQSAASIYVNGNLKAITDDDGNGTVLLKKGKYNIKVKKFSCSNEYVLKKEKKVEILEDTSIEVKFVLDNVIPIHRIRNCDFGDAEVCQELGDLYSGTIFAESVGVKCCSINKKKAIRFYEKAIEVYEKECALDVLESCLSIGDIYRSDIFNKQSKSKRYYRAAGNIYKKDCNSGSVKSCSKLAWLKIVLLFGLRETEKI